MALMKLAWNNGFVIPAFFGLVRTLFSNYRSLRTKLGLAHYTEPEILAVLAAPGSTPSDVIPTSSTYQARMTSFRPAAGLMPGPVAR